ncbi:amino acid ABC transporter permease, partial [Levilactobacillus brevis]|nr:amino acid ABC transporter permease [Levilactobacillus brevis]
ILFFTYFGLPNLGVKPDVIPAAILAMTIFESTMLAEIVRSGIQAVDPGQMEGARANGLTYWQALWYIVLPQALVKMIPALVSQFISLVKDTSLATIILLPEMLFRSQIIYGQNTNYIIPMFVAIAVMYFIVCYLLSVLARYLEKRQA